MNSRINLSTALGWAAAVLVTASASAPASDVDPAPASASAPAVAPGPVQESAKPAAATNSPASDPAPSVRAGHSFHGEAFNEGPRQAAYLMKGMPAIDFPITTTNSLTQAFFTQGVGQLHGFWYFEAERSFRQAARHDTNSAMPYWGMAMANINNSARAKNFIKEATTRKASLPRRETLWIESLATFYEAAKADKNHRKDYIRALERIVFEFPDDIEAKAFLAFHIWDNAGHGWPIPSAQAVESLLKEVFAAQPMHPAHHYRIHLWDGEADEVGIRAVPSAARCGQSGPGIAHLWHMPGHTFSKLKRFHDAAWQQEASVRVDNAQLMADRTLPDQIQNYGHNSGWLCGTYGNVGRVRDAIELAKNMIEMPHHPKFNTMEKKEDNTFYEKGSGGTASGGRRRLIAALMQYELWDELIDLAGSPYLPPTDIAEEQSRRFRALGVAHFSKGNLEEGRRQLEGLEKAAKEMRNERQAAVEHAEKKARDAKESTDKVNKAMLDALDNFTHGLKAIENHVAELKVYEALAEGTTNSLRESAAKLKDKEVSKDQISRILLELDDKEGAVQFAREAYEGATNEVQRLANYADVLHQCGKTNEAAQAFSELRNLSSDIDLHMPVFQRLAPIAQDLGLSADWRTPSVPREDSGERPDITTLGSVLWKPSPALDWTLRDSNGDPKSFAAFRGRPPTLLIFYLGKGCPHCLEQLSEFAPMAQDYADAGITILAISTDSPEGLKTTLRRTDEPFPFTLLSDESLEAFKAYRAYDDFEQIPLHGTFLVDAEGLVRWQDISFEPFKDSKFLLGESIRLLSFSGGISTSKRLAGR